LLLRGCMNIRLRSPPRFPEARYRINNVEEAFFRCYWHQKLQANFKLDVHFENCWKNSIWAVDTLFECQWPDATIAISIQAPSINGNCVFFLINSVWHNLVCSTWVRHSIASIIRFSLVGYRRCLELMTLPWNGLPHSSVIAVDRYHITRHSLPSFRCFSGVSTWPPIVSVVHGRIIWNNFKVRYECMNVHCYADDSQVHLHQVYKMALRGSESVLNESSTGWKEIDWRWMQRRHRWYGLALASKWLKLTLPKFSYR